jgi:hypothetical protein
MNAIFHITGGLGKHVLASSVINSYKKAYPERNIIVSSAYPDVFVGNPNVEESLNLNKNQYFYKNYIHGKDIEIYAHEPYKQTSHIARNTHLVDTWCSMIGIKHTELPSVHINFRQTETCSRLIEPYLSKPLLVFQPFGGIGDLPYSWARDIHPELAQQIVNTLSNKYNILHICNPNHPTLVNCTRVEERLDPGVLFSILKFAEKRVLIDSCLQHAAFALGLSSLVTWGVTSPDQFGYKLHDNILPKSMPPSNPNAYLFNYEIGGIVSECPFENWQDMIDVEKIMLKVNQLM